MKKLIFLFITASILIGCSPQKRLARILDKHPELEVTVVYFYDTNIVDTVTVFIPGDTITLINKDTVYEDSISIVTITKDIVKVVIKDRTFVTTDTVTVTMTNTVVKYRVESKTSWKEILTYFGIIFGLIGLLIIFKKKE